jgi:DNA-binding CsgD family transcriptional regulator
MLEQAFQQLVTILIGVGDLEAAGALLDLASQVEGLSDTARRWHAVLRADLHMAGGHLIAAERELSLLLGARGVDGTLLAETATAKLALVMHLRGNPSGVLGVGNTSVRVLRPGTGWCQQLRAVEAEGALRCRQGDWKAARARFRVSRGLASSAHVDSPAVTQWRVGMARALHGSGELELARHHAEDDLAVATALGAPRPLASALRAMALTSDQPDAKVAMLEHACTLLEDRPLLFDQCETLLELGVAYRGTGREDDSLDALRGAADLAVRMGAGALMSSTHHELLASGARPRRLALSGVSALTPAERKVAAMAASGRKNTEIAGDLYVSIKTVESHLARVYRKLQIDGRVALAERWLQLTAFGDAR